MHCRGDPEVIPVEARREMEARSNLGAILFETCRKDGIESVVRIHKMGIR